MKRMPAILLLLVLAVIVGAAGMLATWDIPAPVASVVKVIPNERFSR